jgi:hypothetical protein
MRDDFAMSAMAIELPLSDAICQMYAGGHRAHNAVNLDGAKVGRLPIAY